MLRVEFEDVGDTLTMRLQGRFVGPFAKDTRDLVTHTKIPPRLVVNLSEVTFVDATGEEMLSWLARIGGRFIADTATPSTSANACICRWRRNVPVPSPGRCNTLAEVLEIRSLVNGKREPNMKDDAEDYPTSYLLYVSSALVAIALVATIAYVFLS